MPESNGVPAAYAVPSLAELGRVHFIGMGGAGMSAIARIMLGQGVPVSGSDAKASAGLSELAALGAEVHVGHAAQNVAAVDTVVVSTAIRADNPELTAAQAAGLRVLHRSQALAAAMAADRVVAVAGTHGKTTTTSMITVMLRGAGVDASFAVGGTVQALGVNAAHGTADVFVAEADESDASFLNYRPLVAVVTNLEADHLDHYGTAEAVFAAFEAFVALLPEDGVLVACADDAGSARLAALAAAAGTRTVTYGFSDAADLRIAPGSGVGLDSDTTLAIPGRLLGSGADLSVPLHLHVPGAHNVSNAAAAVAVALSLDVDVHAAVAALTAFTGAARRFEPKGEGRGVRVFDDYAHHPTEVTAALTAARTVAAGHRVHVLFQPHLFSRTREFAADFARALDLADTVAVLDIYPAREEPIPGVTSRLVTDALTAAPGYAPDPDAAVAALAAAARDGDIILTVGAGDVTAYGPALVAALNAAPAGNETGGTHG
ncbi:MULTISPECIES: UDP-N-acetylmuramate--L-alanine ligase [unclassified Arthrobacter]|uniref:UDP-N-acetylmuramate--L-alanine ligase n=1 Tax=unclassified Arthrobacter TaxID=235627 RepID=UPI00159E1BCA|nr:MULTISPECIES: UDP-N-acetylmuramate--L-alanine ligase [unclassified Arthrobacter]MCQ9164262.1 UDP-N-acetylmuramate--L-alanine ligase [Arthrobacter sp. STN4]NVN00211.1 UDP-N-acetylmuramate--L-alanine ligase [Arthrobacter sp. SDTb3-6]